MEGKILKASRFPEFLVIAALFSLLSCIVESPWYERGGHDRLLFDSSGGSRSKVKYVEINDSLSISVLGTGRVVSYSTIEYFTKLKFDFSGNNLRQRFSIEPQNLRAWLDGNELHLERSESIKEEKDRYWVMIDFRGFVQDSGIGYAPGEPHPRLNLKFDLSRVLWDGYSFVPIDPVFAYDPRSPDAPKR